MRLQDRVAIVTGGSRGIGRAYAERFLREGASVVIADVDAASAAQTVEDLSPLGAIEFVHCDVRDAGSTTACAGAAVDRFGHLDILVNNAALYGDWNMADQSFEYLKQVFDVNLHGVWLMTHAVAPHMVAQEFGRVINQSSAAAYNYRPTGGDEFGGLNAFNYQQTKWGVVGLTQTIAKEYGPHGIRANIICPGGMDEPDLREMYAQRAKNLGMTIEAHEAQILSLTPLRKYAKHEEVANAALFLASSDSSHTTGESLNVSGGRLMS